MTDDRPAPTVTITDPNRPGPVGDVLIAGDDRAPWRAKRWHFELIAFVIALTLAIAVPQQVVSARAAEARKAVAAADNARVSVSLGPADDDPATPVQAVITNDGPDPVTVLSLRLQADGFQTLHVDAPVKAVASVPVPVPDTQVCQERLVYGSQGGLATVRLRAGGRTVTRTVAAQGDLWDAVTAAAQNRCGYLPSSRALIARLATRPVAAGLEVTLSLTNKGRLPLSVGGAYSGSPGLEVLQAPTSLRIPVGDRAVTYRFRLRITDCTQVQQAGTTDQVQLQLDAGVLLSDGSGSGDSVDLSQRFPALTAAVARLAAVRCGTA